ncbi:MAG: PTS sugar transporter subunit IIC [Candidatus Latescibacteria bacterium]|nr:PTS sugar transporter subunit IIC [Candidatus Latescibacterota bacterium]
MNPADVLAWWPQITATALLGALLVLDDTAYAQTWLSQPVCGGVLAGLIWGHPGAGLALGLTVQLLSLGNLPVGQAFVGERVGPLLGAVGAASASGWNPGLPFGGPGADAGRLGWLLLAVALGSVLGDQLIRRERVWHTRLVAGAMRGLREGRVEVLERAHRKSLAGVAVRGAVTTLVAWCLLALLWIPAYGQLPARVVAALALLPWFAPTVAIGSLVELYGSRAGARWIAGGAAGTLAAAWALTRLGAS